MVNVETDEGIYYPGSFSVICMGSSLFISLVKIVNEL
jgi:hypothetical protein